MCPVGFVSDHLEIRWDIDIEAQEQAARLGMRLDRIEMPNADPRFVGVLAAIVRRALAPAARSRAGVGGSAKRVLGKRQGPPSEVGAGG